MQNDFEWDEGKPTLKEIAKDLSHIMQCNCDLDRWEPEKSTGHSWVCDIHKAAKKKYSEQS